MRTPERATAIAEALGRGLPVTAACRIAGISTATYRDWRAHDQDFDEQIELAVAEGIQTRLGIIEKAALEDWRAAAWLLERCSPETFSRNRTEHVSLTQNNLNLTVPREVLDAIADARKANEHPTTIET